MKTCEIIWIKSNKHKIFKDTHKTLQLMFSYLYIVT